MDVDGDGVVSFEEFCLLILKRMAVEDFTLSDELAKKVGIFALWRAKT